MPDPNQQLSELDAKLKSEADAFQRAVNEPYNPAPRAVFGPSSGAAHITSENLPNRFTHHPLSAEQQSRCSLVRAKALEFAELVVTRTPRSPEQTLAIRKIEEAVFWANAAISRNE